MSRNRRIVAVVLGAAWKVLRRQQQALVKIPASNLYYASLGFAFLLDPAASVFLLGLVAVVLVFPLSADPLGLIPRSRLLLWPLSLRDRRTLRAISPWLNPVTWAVGGVILWKRVAADLAVLIGGLFVFAAFMPARTRNAAGRGGLLRLAPRFPGLLGLLVRKNLRGLVSTLDFWCAAIPGLGAAGYALAGLLPKDAGLPMTWVVLLAISTCAQTLFGLDGRGGMTRYRLMPLRGWQILLAKDLAFLLICAVLTAALSPVAGLCGALVALATVRNAAIQENRPQARWRLQAGTSFGPAIVQIILMVGAASWANAKGPLVLIPCVAVWSISLWWGGRRLDS